MLVLTFRLAFFIAGLMVLSNFYEVTKIGAKAWLASSLIEHAWKESQTTNLSVKPWPWADFSPMGELSVPRLGEHHIFLSGDNGNVLAFGPGLNLNSAFPGDHGTSLISGHRDTHFRFLKDLIIGDEIVVETSLGQVSYRVEDLLVVDSHAFSVNADHADRLVLVTCFPFDTLNSDRTLRYLAVARAFE